MGVLYGFSRVLFEILKTAAQNKKTLSSFVYRSLIDLVLSFFGIPIWFSSLNVTFLICLWQNLREGLDKMGVLLANKLAKLDVPVKLMIDSVVAYSIDELDMVFVGADGVVESGGIINMMGTYQIVLVAHSMKKLVYAAAESYKLALLYPLDQKDLEPALRPIDFDVLVPPIVEVERSARDYTHQYLTLILVFSLMY